MRGEERQLPRGPSATLNNWVTTPTLLGKKRRVLSNSRSLGFYRCRVKGCKWDELLMTEIFSIHKVKAGNSYILRLIRKPDRPRFIIIESGSWSARANGAATLLRSSTARANEQLDPRQQLSQLRGLSLHAYDMLPCPDVMTFEQFPASPAFMLVLIFHFTSPRWQHEVEKKMRNTQKQVRYSSMRNSPARND